MRAAASQVSGMSGKCFNMRSLFSADSIMPIKNHAAHKPNKLT